jgi:NAD-dependent dihydropyrimidine dehydrogenase PreA subunit
MCEYCGKHKRTKWFLDEENYKEALLQDKKRQNVLQKLGGYNHEFHLRDNTEILYRHQTPILSHVLTYLANRSLKNDFAGQVVTLEDALKVVELSDNHVLFECACRKLVGDKSDYVCLNFGPLRDLIRSANPKEKFIEVDTYEAKKILTESNEKGLYHEVYFAKAPFPTTLCNCDKKYCLSFKDRSVYGIDKILLKGHEVAVLDPDKCSGCKMCLGRCQFGSIRLDDKTGKACIDAKKCFGCGLCEKSCPSGAIKLADRSTVKDSKGKW